MDAGGSGHGRGPPPGQFQPAQQTQPPGSAYQQLIAAAQAKRGMERGNLGGGFGRGKHQRHAPRSQRREGRAGRLPVVAVMIEQRAIKIGKHDKAGVSRR